VEMPSRSASRRVLSWDNMQLGSPVVGDGGVGAADPPGRRRRRPWRSSRRHSGPPPRQQATSALGRAPGADFGHFWAPRSSPSGTSCPHGDRLLAVPPAAAGACSLRQAVRQERRSRRG
jgi:hypothetical protein